MASVTDISVSHKEDDIVNAEVTVSNSGSSSAVEYTITLEFYVNGQSKGGTTKDVEIEKYSTVTPEYEFDFSDVGGLSGGDEVEICAE